MTRLSHSDPNSAFANRSRQLVNHEGMLDDGEADDAGPDEDGELLLDIFRCFEREPATDVLFLL